MKSLSTAYIEQITEFSLSSLLAKYNRSIDKDDKLPYLIREIRSSYAQTSSHDIDHVRRVLGNALRIASTHQSVDLRVLIIATILHDIARSEEDNDPTGSIDHAILGAKMAKTILKKYQYSSEFINQVTHCVRSHRTRTSIKPKSIEAKILFDADKLDIVGAIGISRMFMMAGELNQEIYSWKPDTSLDIKCDNSIFSISKIETKSKHSPNLEFELKIKKIPELLHFPFSREIAKKRIGFMEIYFGTLKKELNLQNT